jgi:excisionase family DNA binding protein
MAKVAEKSKVIAESPVLTLEEAACYLRISEALLKKEVTLGRVPGRKVGEHWRFFKPALDQWLANSQDLNTNLLSMAGTFADDETFPELLESIKANRKRLNTTLGQ